jgi:hypothetical protein
VEQLALSTWPNMRIATHETATQRIPEARYAYYRRCQVFRKGGEQCKAPAEKGSHICYAHAGQLALAVRRERERRAVLEEAVAQMRRQGRPDCEMADLFMDFKGINVTLSVMAQAVIDGRVDCKTAGSLVVQLQTVSKLLWMMKTKNSPLINTDNTDLQKPEDQSLTAEARRHGEQQKKLPLINTDNADLRKAKTNLTAETQRHSPHQARTGLVGDPGGEEPRTKKSWAANEGEETRIALVAKVLEIANGRGWAHAPPELLRAA